MAYAEGTSVAVEKTVAELVAMIRSAGAGKVAQMDDTDQFVIGFTMGDRHVRFTVTFPPISSEEFKYFGRHKEIATNPQRIARWEQRRMQRMRALLLVIKAKLESVASDVETFEQSFLGNIVVPGSGGHTVYEEVQQRIADAYLGGAPVPLLPDYSSRSG